MNGRHDWDEQGETWSAGLTLMVLLGMNLDLTFNVDLDQDGEPRFGLRLNRSARPDRDSARSEVWGDETQGTLSVNATAPTNLQVYGRIFASQFVEEEPYSDTVLVTVFY